MVSTCERNLPVEHGAINLPSERLQVVERLKRERLPLFVIRQDEKYKKISQMERIPGTSVRISEEGDIYYPVWRERSHILKTELYLPCAKLPHGWTFERLLASRRRPISEIDFHQVRKEGGTVEVAIRNMDHIREKYQEKGKELGQIAVVQKQIERALQVVRETQGVSREEFEEGFTRLYKQTSELMQAAGLKQARSALKRDIDRLLEEASTGEDKTQRRNPWAMLKKLEAAARRIDYRRNESGLISIKFKVNRAGLVAIREKDRGILALARMDLTRGFAAHEVFKYPQKKATALQRRIIEQKINGLVFRLKQTKVKGYKTVAIEAVEKLQKAREMVEKTNYQGAKVIFQEVSARVIEILDGGK